VPFQAFDNESYTSGNENPTKLTAHGFPPATPVKVKYTTAGMPSGQHGGGMSEPRDGSGTTSMQYQRRSSGGGGTGGPWLDPCWLADDAGIGLPDDDETIGCPLLFDG